MNNREIDMDRLNTDIIDPQIRLAKALNDLDIKEFRNALTVVGDLLAIDDQHFCIYERALGKCGAAEFVSECLKAGCDPNHVNNYYNKAAIHFATDSMDVRILRILLNKPGVKVNCVYESLTPWHSLVKKLNTSNYNLVYQCVRILLEYEACVNKSDQIDMSALCDILETMEDGDYQTLVEEMLKVPNFNIDTYRDGELRRILETKYPLIRLPAISQTTRITFYTLLNCLKDNDMEMFIRQYKDESRYTTVRGDAELLLQSIKARANRAFDLLLEEGADYNKPINNKTALVTACDYGNYYALEKILNLPDFNSLVNLMDYIMWRLIRENSQNPDGIFKCLVVLLKSDKIDINIMDNMKNTALHHAVNSRNHRVVRELLKHGAAICITNEDLELPIECIDPLLLEEHLDDCISTNGKKYGEKDYEIRIDFKNFMHSKDTSAKQLSEVLKPIMFMEKSKEYRYLLQHPVISILLYLQWHKLSLLFYLNFLLFVFLSVSTIAYNVCRFRLSEYEMTRYMAQLCSWLGIGCLMIREFLQFVLSSMNYTHSPRNYVDILLILSSLATCCNNIFNISLNWQRNIAVLSILLLAFELISLVGSLPVSSISRQMLMLKEVCKSFFKFFLLYSIFIVTFAVCFYVKGEHLTGSHANNTDTVTSKDDFNGFVSFPIALVQTIVMFTGELNAGSIDWHSNYFLFLAFILIMTILLFNVLNGLAINDTQAIENQAELNEIICRLNLLARYEKQTGWFLLFSNRKPLWFIGRLFSTSYTNCTQISIVFNDKNRSFELKTKIKSNKVQVQNFENESLITLTDKMYDNDDENIFSKNRLLNCCCSFIMKMFPIIDKKTVTQIMAVLQKSSISTTEKDLEEYLNKMIIDFEFLGF